VEQSRPPRDPARELAWLQEAVVELGVGDAVFVDHALRRLALEREFHGGEMGLARLLATLEERAADIGAFGVLALEALASEPDLSDLMRDHVSAVVHAAIVLGAYSYQALTIARLDLGEDESGAQLRCS
jgi:hypothetical protein